VDDILRILQHQKEVKFLTYIVLQDKAGVIQLKLSAVEVNKSYKFKDENACLNKIIDILFELKRLETWSINKVEKRK
jgi:hypothetical protein